MGGLAISILAGILMIIFKKFFNLELSYSLALLVFLPLAIIYDYYFSGHFVELRRVDLESREHNS